MTDIEVVEILRNAGRRWRELQQEQKSAGDVNNSKIEFRAVDKTKEVKIENLKPEDLCQTKLL